MSTDLMTKLALSKKIMDKHNEIPRNTNSAASSSISTPQVQSFDTPQASYNIPQEIMGEGVKNTRPISENVTPDKILSSKLPDEIKKLMIENPIDSPKMIQTSDFLSNDIIEGATKLMGTQKKKIQEPQGQSKRQTVLEDTDLKQMIRDVVRDTVRDVVRQELRSAGFISESESKTNEKLQFKVGKHIFEGVVTKIKKVQ
jgi:hypothetical protein